MIEAETKKKTTARVKVGSLQWGRLVIEAETPRVPLADVHARGFNGAAS